LSIASIGSVALACCVRPIRLAYVLIWMGSATFRQSGRQVADLLTANNTAANEELWV